MGSISLPVIGAVAASAGEGAADAGAAAAVATTASAGVTAATAATLADTTFSAAALAAGTSTAGITAGELAAGATLASGAVSAVGQREGSIASSVDSKQRAMQAQLEAGQKQIGIRENMLKALSSQNAAAGVGGVGTGGSFGANVNRQISQNSNDLLALDANTSAQTSQYKSQASAAINQGYAQMGTSIFDAASGAMKAA